MDPTLLKLKMKKLADAQLPWLGLYSCTILAQLPHKTFLYRDLVYPHGLRTTSSPRSGGADASMLLCYLLFCVDVGHDSATDLVERLWATPYQRIIEGSWYHPSSEGVYHHIFVIGLQLHHQCPEPVEKIF